MKMTIKELKNLINESVKEALMEINRSSLRENYSSAKRKFKSIMKELENRDIDFDYLFGDEIDQVYDTKCTDLIKISDMEVFGIFQDAGRDYYLAVGEELKEAPRNKTAKQLVDIVLKDLK